MLLHTKGNPKTIGFWRLFCPLFQLLGKVGRRRHVPYANVLLAESHPPEAKGENLLGKYAVGDATKIVPKYTAEGSAKLPKKGLTFLSYLL